MRPAASDGRTEFDSSSQIPIADSLKNRWAHIPGSCLVSELLVHVACDVRSIWGPKRVDVHAPTFAESPRTKRGHHVEVWGFAGIIRASRLGVVAFVLQQGAACVHLRCRTLSHVSRRLAEGPSCLSGKMSWISLSWVARS